MVAAGPTVLVTGGNGALGRVLRDALPGIGWRVRSLDVTGAAASDALVGSITDLDTVLLAAEGVDAIVHLGGLARPGYEWQQYLDVNIHGTWTVLEAARLQGVARVVLASSNHAVGYVARNDVDAAADVPARPDSLYGVSKAALESLGAFYADEYGLQTTSLRIGTCEPTPPNVRALSTWLSYPDFVRLVDAALTGPWAGHSTVWGVSRNARRWWSLEAGERIGYQPQDDAEAYAAGLTGENPGNVGGAVPPYEPA